MKLKEGLNHLGEREYQTYGAWRRACLQAGAVRFEGDRDIANAFGADGKGVGEWGGDLGTIYAPPEPPPHNKADDAQRSRLDYSDDDNDLDWECGGCGGPVYSLGRLGGTLYGRCRNCGMDQRKGTMGDSVESAVAYFLNENYYDSDVTAYMGDADSEMVFTNSQVSFPAYINVYRVERVVKPDGRGEFYNRYQTLKSEAVNSREEAETMGRSLWEQFKDMHDTTALASPKSKGQIEIELEQESGQSDNSKNMKSVSEAFRPFRTSSPQRPFKMPDWATPEKSSEGRKLREVFAAPSPPKPKGEPVQPKAV